MSLPLSPSSAFSYRLTQTLLLRQVLKKVQAAAEHEHGGSMKLRKNGGDKARPHPTQALIIGDDARHDRSSLSSLSLFRLVSLFFCLSCFRP
ncbi:hypothetical protein DY000_02053696 [Brassica cretica]|uniref:Uncharacterized protein n=1 Tax=Brassica cretica TaxID=69181 RepID=A0ABQ7AH16_BRACR|nr:hypothetical protein DY000_02053696 [Brassica cretica]